MIRLAVLVLLALVLLSERGEAQQGISCQASEPWPGSAVPANVDVLTPTFGAIALKTLGIDSPPELVAVVVVRGAQSVVILVLRPGFTCRGPPVPIGDYERARRMARGVDG